MFLDGRPNGHGEMIYKNSVMPSGEAINGI
jgi:hypothetical protein